MNKTTTNNTMDIKNSADIGKLIKSVRKKQGMTQTELTAVSGVGVRFIVDLEKGKETVVLGKTLRVLLMLGTDIEVKL